MNSPILTQIIDQVNNLPDHLQQQVLAFVLTLRQGSSKEPENAWDVLETLTGTVEAPSDWSAEHDH